MKIRHMMFIVCMFVSSGIALLGQDSVNCFLLDFEPKDAVVPAFDLAVKTDSLPNVTVTINSADTLGKISKYIFGNAIAVWLGQDINNPTVVSHLQKLSPSFIRFPGGSWSDIYFWKGNPGDLPTTIIDGTTHQPTNLNPQFGPSRIPTVDGYYNMRSKLNAEGLITINYGYARYGLSPDPVAQAAHYAADWVRYDNGQTKFWEIGNENGGPWETGWEIDTTVNKDGQPKIINGALYGKHFRVFVDSMKAAARELGNTIYVGGQVIHFNGAGTWNPVDWDWNEGFFREAGDAADFYVMHNYFGGSATTLRLQVDNARSEIVRNINFIRQDIANKKAAPRPVAITEWNIGGPDQAKTSIANGLQGVVLFNEQIKNNFGLSARWLVANWESDGMFYYGNNSSVPRWNPRPDFYYLYYLQQFTGDHVLRATVTGNNDILAYASKFNSGHNGIVVINKGSGARVVSVSPNMGVGERYYIYSLTGGTDHAQFSQSVYVNGAGPTDAAPWGPIENLGNIKAWAYPVNGEIRFDSPPKSVQFILLEPGNDVVSVKTDNLVVPDKFSLGQNYPNPFNPKTNITYSLPAESRVTLKVYDALGNEVAALLQNEQKAAGNYQVSFDASGLSSSVYFYKLDAGQFSETRKMLLLK